MSYNIRAGGLERHTAEEILRIEPWGPHGVRVRASSGTVDPAAPGALESLPPSPDAELSVSDDGSARLVNGRLAVEASAHGRLRFLHADSGRELLADKTPYHHHDGPRIHAAGGRTEQHFEGYDGERLHGLGQHLHGLLDQKGCVIDLVQGNTVASIPFLHSSRGYGLLWNNPATGRVELGADTTRWVADGGGRVDYWVTAGDTPAQIIDAYTLVTGRPPLLPEWASGFWQSKLRYRTQDELLAVARQYKERGLPLSVIVCDFFHWPKMGDWRFEESEWPDPAAMVKELTELGVRLAVSVWPTVEPGSDTFDELRASGHLVQDADGGLLTFPWPSRSAEEPMRPMAYYDATHPGARAALWQRLHDNYYALGVSCFWLDACEPDLTREVAERAVYAAGPAAEAAHLYPVLHTRTVAEGLAEAGDDRPLSLVRSAWAGSQKYGSALWSGDIPTTFDSLSRQIRAGLNVAMSGIPWWNTDIGGFGGGNPDDPAYREVLIRWFQYGTFSPVMRLHGDREPNHPTFSADMTGGPNEVWSYGEEAYGILREHLLLRERLRPYLRELSEEAHRTGAPPMRPLFFDFPDDERAWDVDDQFLLGPDVLVAPVYEAGARTRRVYLPSGARWLDPVTGRVVDGGTTLDADAPLERIPVFVREGAAVAARLS
ncbi:glycoside hydrolase family 31 protein [Streptomyces himalayensis]|uniref:Glycoside hydrolase family 31 protein n=1 Tax=Streptomyces himalayensis subsp. himalayensis TaxID=2756131 RepID=A0A7W0DRV2_9ACTN|nr:glycoside hydrolase family 31 protein [Streptomyces himalayensis]MBA2950127.1 glycoside hydrolase family 31 protein [Streptomyces himalayensis subsp. himalayensis]